MLHSLLERQIKRYLGTDSSWPDNCQAFLQAVSDAYSQSDAAHLLVEHSLDEMSKELTTINRELRQELAERQHIEAALKKEKEEQALLIEKLEQAHTQLLQSEKMASIGQLAAGVAHEINNPIGYVNSNLGSLRDYCHSLFEVLDTYEASEAELPTAAALRMQEVKRKVDLTFLKEDLAAVLQETEEGISRVRKIVQDLKDFSRADDTQFNWADLQAGLESTLNIVHSEIKYKAEVVKEFSPLPKIECSISQLNQVFMNLLVNAAHAIVDRGTITIRTGSLADKVWVEIADSGTGIPAELRNKIFDPFFTTKPVGKGTGLGLSLSYGIVQKHHGYFEVESEPGKGSRFRVVLPIRQPQ
jgi:signal transduction histidine kinase